MRRVRFTAAAFALLLAYAILRYVVFKGVAPAHIPLYVVNKAVSWLAIALVGASFAGGAVVRRSPAVLARWPSARRWLGLTGFGLAVLHVLLTLPIFTPTYYAKFFAAPDGAGGLTLAAELSLLTGAVALVLLAARAFVVPAGAAASALVWGVLGLTALHCGFMGWAGWWAPAAWPGGLPPITLLAALTAAGAAALRLWGRRPGSS